MGRVLEALLLVLASAETAPGVGRGLERAIRGKPWRPGVQPSRPMIPAVLCRRGSQ